MPITVSTIIAKPISFTWECFTNPDHVIHWNHASEDWHCPKAENNLNIGGKFSYEMAAKDGSMSFDFWGIYDEIQENAVISYTLGDERTVRVTFQEDGVNTIVTEVFDPEHMHSEELQQQGWQAILNTFKAYCESL
jgi:uncharacterized protein YndB with AHSA1/START domain